MQVQGIGFIFSSKFNKKFSFPNNYAYNLANFYFIEQLLLYGRSRIVRFGVQDIAFINQIGLHG